MNEPYESPAPEQPAPAGDDKETRTWAMILHLSVLSGLIVPFAGLVVPIVIYLIKKDSMPGLVPHAHVVFNWMISAVIYAVVGIVLTVILIGVLVLIAVAILTIVFPIIGGIKASEGEVWPYPLSIKVFGRN